MVTNIMSSLAVHATSGHTNTGHTTSGHTTSGHTPSGYVLVVGAHYCFFLQAYNTGLHV